MATNYNIIAITETNFNQYVFNGELFSNNYTVFRRDRESSGSSKKEGGGSLIAINNDFCTNCYRRSEWETNAEDVWVTVVINSFKLNICCIYIPGDLDIDTLNSFYNKLHDIYTEYSVEYFLILGDFNLREL